MTALFKVRAPGPHTTVQDGGRYGFQQFGVPPAGALDPFAYRIANMLVGNADSAAVLETTIIGPEMEVLAEADMAVTGAEVPVTLNGRAVQVWTSFRVRPGDAVKIGAVTSGCRNYIAVTGGIDVPRVMGSRSCYAAAGLGGYKGRALLRDDVLERGGGTLLKSPRSLSKKLIPVYSPEIVLRAIPGPQDDFFDRALETFFCSEFTVSTHANRMGYRLEGPVLKHRTGVNRSIISEPSLPGGVQVPPDGKAIILLVEQTAGGYTKIATVTSTDITRIAQAKPGDRLCFKRIGLEISHSLYREHRVLLERIKRQIEEGG